MNISTQICGLSILLIILFFFFRAPKVDFLSTRLFLGLMISVMVCLFFDIVSVYGIANDTVSSRETGFLCRMYLVTLILVSFMGLQYMLAMYTVSDKILRVIRAVYGLILIVAVIAVMTAPIGWYHRGDVVYSRGLACSFAYVFCGIFMLSTVMFAVILGRTVSVNVFASVIVWIGFEVAAAVSQYMHPRLLLVGFASTIGLLVLFLELENPKLSINRTTDVFNLSTLNRYIDDFYKRDRQFSYIIFKLVYEGTPSAGHKKNIFYRTARVLEQQKAAKVFFTGQASFVLIYRDKAEADTGAMLLNSEVGDLCDATGAGFLEMYEPEGRRARSLIEILDMADQISVNGEYADRRIITISEHDYERFRQQREVIKEIDKALEDDRVEAFFQPIFSFKDDKFTIAEALVRIRQEDGTIMPPGRFIPVAEKTGQVTKIGDRMFEKTLQLIKDEKVNDLGVQFIDVNLSVRQCEDESLATRYLEKMKKAGVSPSMFCFEITESSMIINRTVLLNNMNTFRDAGCSVSLDDFGNGESNLNYVIDMPIDLIKADRSMVSNYRLNNRVGLIMDSMIHMAKGLSLKIVAEGVETEEDLKAMKDLNIDYIQGYYFSKPLPRDDYVSFIRKNNSKSA